MCTELLLAIVYFITICTVNYFLLKLVISYVNRIKYLSNIKASI